MESKSKFYRYLPADPARQVEVDHLIGKFRDEEFLERWKAAPTSTNLEILAARAAAGRRGLRIMDVCCGTGKAGLGIAKHADVNEIVFLDGSPRALELARETFEERHCGRLISAHFVACQDAESEIPPELGAFDAIVIRYAFHLFGLRDRLLACLFARLKPGGRPGFQLGGRAILAGYGARAAKPSSMSRADPTHSFVPSTKPQRSGRTRS